MILYYLELISTKYKNVTLKDQLRDKLREKSLKLDQQSVAILQKSSKKSLTVFLSNSVSKFPFQPSLPTPGFLSFPRMLTVASLILNRYKTFKNTISQKEASLIINSFWKYQDLKKLIINTKFSNIYQFLLFELFRSWQC